MPRVEVKVKDVIAAIEKNGLEQTVGNYWRNENGRSTGFREDTKFACAVGMAAINLNVTPSSIHHQLPWARKIEEWNDKEELSFKEIAERYRADYPDILDYIIELYEPENREQEDTVY